METKAMAPKMFTEESEAIPGSNPPFWLSPAGLRPPDWRWQLARLCLEGKLPRLPQLRDEWVQRCARFKRPDRVRSTSCRPRRRASSDAILSEAARVRFASDPLITAELEAWILTASHPEFIAQRCNLSAEVVAAYEAVFFDVRPYLDVTGYIFHRVIGRPITHGFCLSDLGSIWKFIAYMRGRHSLEVLLYTFPGQETRSWPASIEATPAEQARLVTRCKLAVLTRCIRIEELKPAELFRFLLLNQRVQRRFLETERIGSGLAIGKRGDVPSPLLQRYLEASESIVSRPDDSRATLRPRRGAGDDQKDSSAPASLPACLGFGDFDKPGGPVAAWNKESA
jgi:hypothetical protein